MLARREKLAVIGSLLLFSLVTVGVAATRSDRIYAVPTSTLPFSALVAGTFLVAFGYSAVDRSSRAALVPLTLFAGLILAFPLLFVSGVYGFSTDTLYHLGKARDILRTGHMATESIYPYTHVAAAQFSRLLAMPLGEVAMLLPPVFFGVFVAGITLLARSWDRLETRLALLCPFAFIMTLGFDTGGYTYYKPYFAAVLFSGFALAVFLRSLTTPDPPWSWQVLSVCVLLVLVFIHPITFIAAFLLFVAYYGLASGPLQQHASLPFSEVISDRTRLLFAFSLTSFLFGYWMLLQAEVIVGVTFHRAITLLRSPSAFFGQLYRGGGAAGYPLTAIRSQSGRLMYLFRYYGLQYGGALLALVTTGVWALWSALRARGDRVAPADLRRDGVILAWLAGASVLLLSNATANVLNVGITRPVPLLLVVFAIPVGRLATHGPRARRAVVAVLLVCAAAGLVVVYPSPITYTASPQATTQDVSGMAWLFATKSDAKIHEYQMDQHRFGAFILGNAELAAREDIFSFGATTPESILWTQLRSYGRTGELTVRKPLYLPVSEFDHWYVSRYYPSPARERGLRRLASSPPARKIYANGELAVYHVTPESDRGP